MRSDNEPLRLLTRIILELELFKKSIRKNKANATISEQQKLSNRNKTMWTGTDKILTF